MLAVRTRLFRAIRYLRPDRNPLRRPVDRTHSRIVIALMALVLAGTPVLATAVGRSAYSAGLRVEHRQAASRHPVEASVLGAPPTVSRSGLDQTTQVRWREPGGAVRTGTVPLRTGDRPGITRPIWVDADGRPVAPPNSHTHTVVDAVATTVVSVMTFWLLLGLVYMLVEHRLDRRRSAAWEKEWTSIAPLWTGRS